METVTDEQQRKVGNQVLSSYQPTYLLITLNLPNLAILLRTGYVFILDSSRLKVQLH